MENSKEILLERYIRFPETLSSDEKTEAQQLILKDHEAKEYIEWLYEFYKEYDVLKRPKIIELGYQSFEFSGTGAFILSAMTETESKQELTTSATFSSADESTLIRVLKESTSDTYQIHVISNFIKSSDRLIIGFKNTGLDLITEPGGKLMGIPSDYFRNIDWNKAQIIVRTSLGDYEYIPEKSSETVKLSEHLSFQFEGPVCSITKSEGNISRVLFEREQNIELLILESGSTTFSIDPHQRTRLYFYI